MGKPKTTYICRECGASFPKWSGQCADCGAWNSLEETASPSAARTGPGQRGNWTGTASAEVTSLADVRPEDSSQRLGSGLSELDRVLGGGLVPGSVVLLGGDPGIGKSTLLLQAQAALASEHGSLYVTGEESAAQVAMRARRLDLDPSRLRCLTETRLEVILATAASHKPAFLVVDSIQTLWTEALQSAPGAVAQVRECAARLVQFAKQTGCAVVLVGHVTKEGALAGPRVLEHMVDAVLYFESDSGSRYRLIRAVKNRFGAANELGVFAMTGQGLKPIANPSAIFLSGAETPSPGSCVLVTREGTRPLMVEVQALVAPSTLSNPRRVAVGIDPNRLALLLAVMNRHAGIQIGDQDVFVNVAGGIRVSETASDLAIALALKSSLRESPLPKGLVAFGEIGLAGELRPVYNGEERLREAAGQGFTEALVPEGNLKGVRARITARGFRTLAEALAAV
ncbi:DNA repair protein RadA [Wenzhouxiangella limi]|uniref:DNA repair protein RadA n=1 Tax=Wenzhouxiangella limi TaxID=2707351 RepID=A0A845UZS2_9GAMM|nr:DNA repair protein RadA [Wenzhouxiangella limi]NDY95430.1 DNA repair protein RadA [Wenzhouxiangella limi]